MKNCWFVGLTTLDVIHHLEYFPAQNTKSRAISQSVRAGGPAANAAATGAALGVSATLVTVLGQEPAALIAQGDLESSGVRIVDCALEHELSISSVLLEPGGDRTVVSTDAGSPRIELPDLDSLPIPEVLLLDGHHPALQRHALEWATAANVPVVVDAGRWRPIFSEILPIADVVACSADFRLPDHAPQARAPFELAKEILALGAKSVVVTDGPHPVYYAQGTERGTAPVPQVRAVETLGAGDAFHGALTASIANGRGLPQAIQSAIEVASAKVQRFGR